MPGKAVSSHTANGAPALTADSFLDALDLSLHSLGFVVPVAGRVFCAGHLGFGSGQLDLEDSDLFLLFPELDQFDCLFAVRDIFVQPERRDHCASLDQG